MVFIRARLQALARAVPLQKRRRLFACFVFLVMFVLFADSVEADATEGLSFLHDNGMVHCDHKLINTLVCRSDGPSGFVGKVTDPGLWCGEAPSEKHGISVEIAEQSKPHLGLHLGLHIVYPHFEDKFLNSESDHSRHRTHGRTQVSLGWGAFGLNGDYSRSNYAGIRACSAEKQYDVRVFVVFCNPTLCQI